MTSTAPTRSRKSLAPVSVDLAAENERLRAELADARAQQAGTAQVLRFIQRAGTDLAATLTAILEEAGRLCRATDVFANLREGAALRPWAAVGPLLAGLPFPREYVSPLNPEYFDHRAVLELRTVHVPDMLADEHAGAVRGQRFARTYGFHTLLAVPLLRRGDAAPEAFGLITAVRPNAEPFTDDEIRLLESFADQAAIAVEHARLFSELQASNSTLAEQTVQLKEALEQQAATSDVLRAIASSPADLPRVLQAICESAARLCAAPNAALVSQSGESLRIEAATGPQWGGVPPGTLRPLAPSSAMGRAFTDARTVHVPDWAAVTEEEFPVGKADALALGERAQLATPLLREGAPIGVLSVMRGYPAPFEPQHISLLQTFADQAVIAIENSRLFSELQQSNATLKEALEQQTATAEVLRVITGNPSDAQRVLDTIAASAARLCGAQDAVIGRVEGDHYAVWSHFLAPDATATGLAGGLRAVPLAGSFGGRAVLDRRTIHILDAAAVSAEEYPVGRANQPRTGQRTTLVTPLLREGEPLGFIMIRRLTVEPFTEQQIRLLETFADQAVVAIENARLFQELTDANATLKEALEQQTATAEVLQLIGRAAFDLERVLQALTENAVRLCRSDSGALLTESGGRFRVRAMHGASDEAREFALRTVPHAPSTGAAPSGLIGRVAAQRAVVHVHDAAADPELASAPATARFGVRTRLGVPLLRDGALVGAFSLDRTEARPFTDREIALVQTFADQAVIALENARLIGELQERDERRRQELERASAIQQRLLPSSIQGWPGVLEVAHHFRPAVETSGDFYDVLQLAPCTTGALPPLQIAVGDVAGKGMAAALVTALARSALHATASVPTRMASPAGTLREAGARLHRDVGSTLFVACALAVVEPPGLHNAGPLLRLANAAQVPVLLVRDGRATEIEPMGYRLPLGAQADGAYRDAEVELRAGDVVVFSSDGLVEAPALSTAAAPSHLPPSDKPAELFGFARLSASASHWAALAPTAEEVAAGIWSDLTAWCGSDPHHDDMTLLVLRVSQ